MHHPQYSPTNSSRRLQQNRQQQVYFDKAGLVSHLFGKNQSSYQLLTSLLQAVLASFQVKSPASFSACRAARDQS